MKKATTLWRIVAVFGFLLVAAISSCTSFADYCQASVDCEGGNDKDVAACEVALEAAADKASLYGCSEWWDLYSECAEEKAGCENDNYSAGDSCEDEGNDYGSCISQ